MSETVGSSVIGFIIALGVSMSIIFSLLAPPATVTISGQSVVIQIGVLLPVVILVVTFAFVILAILGGRSYDRWRSPTYPAYERLPIPNAADLLSKAIMSQPDVYDPLCPYCLHEPRWSDDSSEWPTHCGYCGTEIGQVDRRWHSRYGWLKLVFMRLEQCGILHLRQFSLLALINNSVAPELDLLDWLRGTGKVLSSRDVVLMRYP